MHHQESRIVAIDAEYQNLIQSRPVSESPSNLRLQQLIDTGTLYVAQNLSSSQFATLQAIAARVLHPDSRHLAARLDGTLTTSTRRTFPYAPTALDYHLGLDELDAIARTRTGYPFAELPDEIQDAILGLIASRDLTTQELDLALWLEDLHATAAAL
jgi:Gluconate 2-dehydrogenase subunit 3